MEQRADTSGAVAAERDEELVPVAQYLAELRARRREVADPQSGEARALMLAIGYLQAATPARARWALASVLEAERGRAGEFWRESSRALRRIVRELGQVVP